jgi:hypothetical protein
LLIAYVHGAKMPQSRMIYLDFLKAMTLATRKPENNNAYLVLKS